MDKEKREACKKRVEYVLSKSAFKRSMGTPSPVYVDYFYKSSPDFTNDDMEEYLEELLDDDE